ncbi:hypothetical protein [Microbacterium sp.]|uniref:hypothetical protein n=1 Tax=Microbacterium sp. TaxID=51671 RepID=UPI0033414C5F
MITTGEIAARMSGERLPLLTLEEFFEGNAREDSLAPNRWGHGRPPLAEIAARLRALLVFSDVVWVRVELHPDTESGEPEGVVLGESIVICTTAPAADLEARLDAEGLRSDGIVESDESSLDDACGIPPVVGHERIVFLVWD